MSRIEIVAENLKLARLLRVPTDQLSYLQAMDARQLCTLRHRLTDSLFDETRPTFQRVAAASKLLPNALVALIGEKVFGPMLCARVAGLMPPDRCFDIALKLPDAFLADVAVELDPRSAREVIARMPKARVIAIAAILVARQDYVTMGRFVDYLSADTIRATIESIRDDAALLKTAFFVENKTTLNQLVGLLPIERIKRIVILAGDDKSDLWTEALGLMSHVDDSWKKRIGDLAAEQDESVLSGLAQTAQRLQLWDSVLPIVGCMSASSQRKLAGLPVLAQDEVLRSVIATADARALWGQLLPLVGYMGTEARRSAARIVEHLPRETLLRLIRTAGGQKLWPDLIGILAFMDEAEKREVVRLIGEQDDVLLGELLGAVHRAELWAEVLPLVAYMGPSARRTAARVVPGFPGEVLLTLIDTARRLALWPELIGILADMEEIEQREVARLIADQPEDVLGVLIDAIHGAADWSELLLLVRHFEDPQIARLGGLVSGRSGLREAFERDARRLGLWERVSVAVGQAR